jgi:hypothetical protein
MDVRVEARNGPWSVAVDPMQDGAGIDDPTM